MLEGTVVRMTNFGVFVNIGEVDGLVHISQLAHTRVDHPSDVVKEGVVVKVKVLAIDEESGRVSLSVKAALPAPWDGIEQKIKEGDVLEGTVKRLARLERSSKYCRALKARSYFANFNKAYRHAA
ncbi:hypothetical protein LR68_00607 [Anoxybacillus sp. BCO1]|nr:hypothetical protein LR68_00607 [Anoxybacillus sp. BCO1]